MAAGDCVVRRAGILLTVPRVAPAGDPLGEVRRAALVVTSGRVSWIGADQDLDTRVVPADALEIDAAGALVTPGLVDAHTHPVFAGNRADEFAARSRGATYLEIARGGGGIRSTVRATRAASVPELTVLCERRLGRMLALGTTAAEAKTGYALSLEGELRLLDVLTAIAGAGPLRLSPTLLAAHAVPEEATDVDARERWVRDCAESLPPAAVRRGARAVDVYADEGAYSIHEARRILVGARAAGLAIRMHGDQLVRTGGAELAVELGCVSVDHLERVSPEGVAALAHSATVAVCLPGAALTLGLPLPPARALLDAGATVALGTDLNPGSSLTESLALQMWLACTQMRMTVEEAWRAATVSAARAAILPDSGSLATGSHGDFVVWDAEHPAEIPQHYGVPLARRVVVGGTIAHG